MESVSISKMTINPELLKVSKSHGEARNIKFGQQVNLIQMVALGTPPQRVVTSLPHNHHVTLTNLCISGYRGYFRQIWAANP